MGKIFYIMGKSSTGKDTFYKRLMEEKSLGLKNIVMYTTRPIRAGEKNGLEYYFVNEDRLQELTEENKVIECRSYDTMHGVWHYFTVCDDQIHLEKNHYIVIGTLESYEAMRRYFGEGVIIPIYIEVENGVRLQRALDRERMQDHPRYEEMCRRYLADSQDFSEEKIERSGITKRFQNNDFSRCLREIMDYIQSFL
ncbi:MAG: guanylate kinase [Lachnospiraceae bacterium]